MSVRKVGRQELVAYVREMGPIGVKAVAAHFSATRNTARAALDAAVGTGDLDSVEQPGRRGLLFFPGGREVVNARTDNPLTTDNPRCPT